VKRHLMQVSAIALVAIVALIALTGGGPPSHQLQVVIPDATGIIPGERVVAAGQTAGSIATANVTRGGEAQIVINIDSAAWPVPRDSTLELRMGGTIKYTDRYVELQRGHGSAVFADHASVPAVQFIPPVEYDSVFDIFNPATRSGMKSFLDNAGPSLRAAALPLRHALGDADPALTQVVAVVRDLGFDQQALSTLVSASDEVVHAAAQATPGVQRLLAGAANTFSAVADQSQSLRSAIGSAPAAFHAASGALDHASRTLVAASTLSDRLGPGVVQLRQLATPLDAALSTLVGVAPDAVSALDTVRQSAPTIDALLSRARQPLLPRIGSIGRQAARQVACIRPYTPEIAGTLSNWAGFWAFGDHQSTVLHAVLGPTATSDENLLDSAQTAPTVPGGLQIDFPQVPGEVVNQPWFQPQCGITANDLKVADDPEAHDYDPGLDSKLVPYQ
jgi:ABC-type transporter Mla subunit MlaD